MFNNLIIKKVSFTPGTQSSPTLNSWGVGVPLGSEKMPVRSLSLLVAITLSSFVTSLNQNCSFLPVTKHAVIY